MADFIDIYGATVTDNNDGTWTRGGVTLSEATQEQAESVFAGMAPDGWEPPPPPVPTTISALDFIRRFTPTERHILMTADPVWGVMIAAAGTIDVTNAELIADINAAVTAGALSSTRAAQVLNLSQSSP